MADLDKYLVSLGVKGQDVVLSTMNKIRKSGEALTKKKSVLDFISKITKASSSGLSSFKNMAKGAASLPFEKKQTDEEKKKEKADKENNKQFSDGAKKFGEGAKSIASAASTLDPTATLASATSAIGTSLSGISFLGVSLGRLPEGIAAMTNSAVSMAKNSIDMAKQATAAYSQLASRNAARSFYGGNVEDTNQISRNEMSMLVDSISGSMGKIQKPLADELNKLTGTKDTKALARAGAGDWESTGSDKGWLLQQMSNGMSGMPPSIKQQFQASMLRQNSDLIQSNAGEAGPQKNAAELANMEEDQTKLLYDNSLKGESTDPRVLSMMGKLNTMQSALYQTGLAFNGAISDATDALMNLPAKMKRLEKAFEELASSPSKERVKKLFVEARQ